MTKKTFYPDDGDDYLRSHIDYTFDKTPNKSWTDFIEKSLTNYYDNITIKSLLDSRHNLDSRRIENSNTYDVLIICALPDEVEGVYDAFDVDDNSRETIHYDYRVQYNFIFHSFNYNNLSFAVVTQSSMGMANAASITARAILAIKPKIVAMTGICAGRKGKANKGDIIVANQVYDYTAGKKYEEKFAPRPDVYSVDETIKNHVTAAILRNTKFCNSLLTGWDTNTITGRVEVHLKAMASGTAVIDDKVTVDDAATYQDDLYAIDMESYGIALSATALNTRWIVIKGIQDFANGDKANDEITWRRFAAKASAQVLKEIIHGII